MPGAKLPVLADVQSLSTAGTQAVVQVGPYLTANLTASLGGSSGTSLSFTNVQLNLGGFASSFLGKAIADLQAFTRPLQPLADDLETPFIAGSNFTTLWVMQQLGYGQAAGYARTFADTVHAINALTPPVAGTATSVNLGSFTAQVQSPTQLVTVGSTLASVAQVDSHLGSLATVFAQLRSIPGLRLAIDDPQQLLSLVTGKASTLFTYTLSVPQAISVSVQQQLAAIPVSPVTLTEVDIYANLGVSAGAQATFGFDTTGYQAGNLANGFFIQNASLTARLTAGLSGAPQRGRPRRLPDHGGRHGIVTASLHGANGSNKVYANQFATGGLVFSAPNWNFGITSKFVPPAQMLDLAIHQFGPYLKTLVGTDYQIAANIMNGKGVSPTDIAVALGTVYGIPPQTTAGVLHKLNATATQVAGTLQSAYKATTDQVVADLSGAQYAVQDIAGTLYGTYKETYTQIASTLHADTNSGLNTIAYALYHAPIGIDSPAWPRRLQRDHPRLLPDRRGPGLRRRPGHRRRGLRPLARPHRDRLSRPGRGALQRDHPRLLPDRRGPGLRRRPGHRRRGLRPLARPHRDRLSRPGRGALQRDHPRLLPDRRGPGLRRRPGHRRRGLRPLARPHRDRLSRPGRGVLQRDHPRLLPDRRGPGLRRGRAIGGVAYDLWHAPIGIDSPGLAAAPLQRDHPRLLPDRRGPGLRRRPGHRRRGLRPLARPHRDRLSRPGRGVLHNGITHDYSQIAGALASGAGRDVYGVAYDLWHAPIGISAGTLVGVLESVFSLNPLNAWSIVNGL